MKPFYLILLILLSVSAFGQIGEVKSKERDTYYSNRSFPKFTPIDSNLILNYTESQLTLTSLSNYVEYNDTLIFTTFQDSVFNLGFDKYQRQYIGGIERFNIIKYDKYENIEAFLYETFEFEDRDYGAGLWLAISRDNGKLWTHFYTGITQRQPIFAKWYSKIKLIKSKDKIQIEAALLQQISPPILPSSSAEYKPIKDGLILTLNINELGKDSDSDGLTDIIERKLYLNPRSKDTDGDGVVDSKDLNPRVYLPRTDYTRIFETVINEEIPFDTTGILIPFDFIPKTSFTSEKTKTILIVSSNISLQSIQPNSTRVILISEEDYSKQKGNFKSELNQMWISPLFKVDGEDNTYTFSTSLDMGGDKYLVRKTEKGWLLLKISTWII